MRCDEDWAPLTFSAAARHTSTPGARATSRRSGCASGGGNARPPMEGLRALDAAAVALLERRLTPELYEPLTSYLRDELGAGVLLMRALLAGFDPGPLAATLLELSTDLADSGYPELSERCLRLRATLADNADGCAAIAAIRRLGTELPS